MGGGGVVEEWAGGYEEKLSPQLYSRQIQGCYPDY